MIILFRTDKHADERMDDARPESRITVTFRLKYCHETLVAYFSEIDLTFVDLK